MKKTIFITLLLTTVLILSCSKKEDLLATDLTGTEWKSNNIGTNSDPEYRLLKFTSNSLVTIWYMAPNLSIPDFVLDFAAAYSIAGNKVIFNFVVFTATGTIENNTMKMVYDDGSIETYTKQ